MFSQNTSIPNSINVLLSLPNDTYKTYTGELTISEIKFQNISDQPKVPISLIRSKDAFARHFSVLLGPDRIIGPDGNAIKTTSNASYAPSHNQSQLQVVFDSGVSLPQLPEYVVNAIYSGAKGAHLVDGPGDGKVWIVDCEAEINLTFKIGGQSYPVHPIDVTRQDVDSDGESYCFGTVRVASPQGSVMRLRLTNEIQISICDPWGSNPTFDAILGMTFLSNVYLLLDYGDVTDGTSSNVFSIRPTSLHDGSGRSSRRLCCDASERETHGIKGEELFLEARNPHRCGGGARGRCVSGGQTAQACVPSAARPGACGRYADGACQGIQFWGFVFRSME